MKPKLFVTRREDDIPKEGLNLLTQKFDVTFSEDAGPISRQHLMESIADKEALFCLLTDKIDEQVLQKAEKLKIIGSMAVGYDHLDLEAIKKRNIKVGYTPDVLTEATAELTVSLLLATSRRLFEGSSKLRNGEWGTWSPLWLCSPTLHGATVGIVGLGRIGQKVQQRLVPFGVKKFLYYGRSKKSSAEENSSIFTSFDTLLATSDFIIVTAALTPETKNLFNKAAFDQMKSSCVFVNTSRGGLVDQEALFEALKENKIFAAGLDVMTPEPLPVDHPLTTLPNCVLIPHLGSATIQTRTAMAVLTAQNIIAAFQGQEMPAKLV